MPNDLCSSGEMIQFLQCFTETLILTFYTATAVQRDAAQRSRDGAWLVAYPGFLRDSPQRDAAQRSRDGAWLVAK